jgi:hypothetical protein
MELLDAHHLIALDIVARARDIIVADVELWEEYPDIMESDFRIITAMVTQSGNDHRPDADKVKEAYAFLNERYKETTELEPRFAVVHDEWQNAGITASDERVRAVLELHEPSDLGNRITCTECMSYDSEGDSSSDWPCDTYKAVMG